MQYKTKAKLEKSNCGEDGFKTYSGFSLEKARMSWCIYRLNHITVPIFTFRLLSKHQLGVCYTGS